MEMVNGFPNVSMTSSQIWHWNFLLNSIHSRNRYSLIKSLVCCSSEPDSNKNEHAQAITIYFPLLFSLQLLAPIILIEKILGFFSLIWNDNFFSHHGDAMAENSNPTQNKLHSLCLF